MKSKVIVLCVAGVLALAALAFAQPGPGPGAGGRGAGGPGGSRGGFGPGMGAEMLAHNPDLAKELGVTDEQIAALKTASYAHEQQTIKLRADFEAAQLEVRKLMEADTPDKAAVLAAVENAGKAGTELRKAQVSHMLQVREIVGKDVTKKLRAELRERMKERREERGGAGWGPGRGPRGPGMGRGPGGPGDDDPEDRGDD
jgi:Spy/CpxP family protein refolding chaperone